jgi:hypothetical protein
MVVGRARSGGTTGPASIKERIDELGDRYGLAGSIGASAPIAVAYSSNRPYLGQRRPTVTNEDCEVPAAVLAGGTA